MTKNPLINGFAATAYIVLVALVMSFGSNMMRGKADTFLAPVAGISLFTLSAAVMGYVFCFEPGQLYFSGKKAQAVKLFLQTVLVFGCITTVLLVLAFSGVFS